MRVLDIATGAGDIPIALGRLARRHGATLKIDGCDRSATAIAYATRRAQQAHAEIGFFEFDALAEAIPRGYDVLIISQFLHHLDNDRAIELLRRMRDAAGRLLVIHDLVRSRRGSLLAWIGTRLLSSSQIIHRDGLRSVKAAFTIGEVYELAGRAGLHGCAIACRWPARFILTWNRD